jgi:2-deoxy-D-gluconate 3-dehydrogenase
MGSNFDLAGKVAVVTGGAGGLGQAICKGLSEAGVKLVIGDLNTARLKELEQELKKTGGEVVTSELNVIDEESLKRFVERAIKEYSKIDILVNCAGMTIKKPILDFSVEEWDKVVDINLKSVFLCSRLVVPHMIKNGGGKIINFCSMGSYVSITTSAPYCAAKGGLMQLTKVMAMEWAPHNIQVNAVAPGFFNTQLASGIKNNPHAYEKLMMKSPMKRLGEVSELVGTIHYLASPATDFITGICIPIDGGFLADGI